MKSRDQISHVRINNPNVRRQWVPIRECEISSPPVAVSEYGNPCKFPEPTQLEGFFRVKRRLAHRIIDSRGDMPLRAFMGEGQWMDISALRRDAMRCEDAGFSDKEDKGVIFRFRVVIPISGILAELTWQ